MGAPCPRRSRAVRQMSESLLERPEGQATDGQAEEDREEESGGEMSTLYETDAHAWAFEQARRLRAGEPIDVENVAEELEGLGRDWERTLDSHLTVLLLHMLKRDFQPGRHTRSWDLSIKEQRRQVNRTLTKMPSLRRLLAEAIADAYPIAVLQASRETRKVEDDFPSECPYSIEQILNEEPAE